MLISEEEHGGQCVTMKGGDNLADVPRSHRRLISPEIKSWWPDPMGELKKIAKSAASPKMAAWFLAMGERGRWKLELHKSLHGSTAAGFMFDCPGLRGAEVAPPPRQQFLDHLPEELAAYYRLVGSVDWMGFNASGGLAGNRNHDCLAWQDRDYHGADIDLARTFIFGCGPGGDMLVYTADGRGGWVGTENGKIHLLGTVLDTIDWVYNVLLENGCPDFDYSW